MRVEATAQFLVLPTAKTGVSPYAGVGIAYVGSRAYRGTGVLMVLVGCESAAGRPRGWFGELGLGEGVRLRVGWRWRRFPGRWTPWTQTGAMRRPFNHQGTAGAVTPRRRRAPDGPRRAGSSARRGCAAARAPGPSGPRSGRRGTASYRRTTPSGGRRSLPIRHNA